MKYIHYYIATICTLLIGFSGCSEEPEAIPDITTGGKTMPLELSAHIMTQTRSTLAGDAFDKDDTFTLYHGNEDDILNNKRSSIYNYDSDKDKWDRNPGIFWDDLDRSVYNSFTGIMTNGGSLTLGTVTPVNASTFKLGKDQSTAENYIKNDLLVAYGVANYTLGRFRNLVLSFNHVFARLTISIKETSKIHPGDKAPLILGEKTIVQIKNVKTGAELKFNVKIEDPSGPGDTFIEGTTDVTPLIDLEDITTLRTQEGTDKNDRTFVYEAILPAQDMKDMRITLIDNENGKEYIYELEDAVLNKGLSLEQGKSTTLNLKIEKSEIEAISAEIKDWDNWEASAKATPDDYPVIEIGGNDGPGGGGGTLDPTDDYAGKTIRLTRDVTMTELGLLPIGTQDKPFRGTFDGQGFKITGVNVNATDKGAFLGVFGYTDGATIRDLKIEGTGVTNINQSATSATGGLVGYANNTYISNCHVEYTGGVSAAYDNAGGLIGYMSGVGYIRHSSANTPVSAGHDYGGGLIGRSENGMELSYSFATGNVEIKGDYVGGLIGHSTGGVIQFCYAWGNAKGARYAGGLIGRSFGIQGSKILNSYAAGTLVSGTYRGGLIGSMASAAYITVNKCYWNVNLASGLGCSNTSFDSTNKSFSLVTSADAMTIMLNGICNGVDENAEWVLAERSTDKYQLPVLKANNGKANNGKEDPNDTQQP